MSAIGFPYFSRREPKYEDDNLYTAEGSKSSNRRNKVRHAIRRLTNPGAAPPANLLAPEARPFRWMITSHYLPDGYQTQNLREKAPWFIFLRCLLVDLPGQLKDGLGTESWRHHFVEPTGEIEFLTRKEFKNYPYLKWGRRMVFSEQTREEPRWLTGQWLVIAYVWSESREWLRGVDVANLISFNNETCIFASETNPDFKIFYQLERIPGVEEPVVTLFSPPGREIPPGAPVPERLEELSCLMGKEARALLYDPF